MYINYLLCFLKEPGIIPRNLSKDKSNELLFAGNDYQKNIKNGLLIQSEVACINNDSTEKEEELKEGVEPKDSSKNKKNDNKVMHNMEAKDVGNLDLINQYNKSKSLKNILNSF